MEIAVTKTARLPVSVPAMALFEFTENSFSSSSVFSSAKPLADSRRCLIGGVNPPNLLVFHFSVSLCLCGVIIFNLALKTQDFTVDILIGHSILNAQY
jgi:hypothetical protein